MDGGSKEIAEVPWKEIRAVDERLRFIAAVQQDPRGNFSRLCESFGISRAKGYKWLERYREEGPKGLEDRKPVAGAARTGRRMR